MSDNGWQPAQGVVILNRVLECCMLSTLGIRHPHRHPLGRTDSRRWTQQRRTEKSNKTRTVHIT